MPAPDSYRDPQGRRRIDRDGSHQHDNDTPAQQIAALQLRVVTAEGVAQQAAKTAAETAKKLDALKILGCVGSGPNMWLPQPLQDIINGTVRTTPRDGKDGMNGTNGLDSVVPGPPITLTIGTVTAGDTAFAEITGGPTDYVLNLVLPKGDKGDKGDAGTPGLGTSITTINYLDCDTMCRYLNVVTP